MLRPCLLKCAALSPPAPTRLRLAPRRTIAAAAAAAAAAADALPRPWPGLQAWRDSPLNDSRKWGPDGPDHLPTPTPSPLHPIPSSLSEWGTLVLSTADPLLKARLTQSAFSAWHGNGNANGEGGSRRLLIGVSRPPDLPARPLKPTLVSTKEMPAPKNSGLPLNAYLLHNLAHVELNAIDLAWDTVVRFSPYQEELGEGFFSDFAHVADDESRHFGWCVQRLGELGFSYGDMPAHNLLWRECERSAGSVAARLAVIPMVQEARGLDAGPRLVQRLVGFGDCRTSKVVTKIAEEELAHVAVGVFWFLSVCEKMGRAPCSTFKGLLKELNVELKGPFNVAARDEAGIPRDWYDDSSPSDISKSKLEEVHNRLAYMVSMEQANSALESDCSS